MIEWLALLVAVVFFGVANFRRKGFTRHASHYEAPFWESLGFLPVMALVLLFHPLRLSFDFILLSFGSAALVIFATLFFYRALKGGQVSIATTIASLSTHVSAFLAFIVFSEAFTARIIGGIILAATTVLLLTKSRTVRVGRWLLYAFLALFFFAFKNLIDKQISVSYDPLSGFVMISLLSIVMYASVWLPSKKRAPDKTKLKLASNGVLIAIAYAMALVAYSKLPLSVAAPVLGMNLLVTVMLGTSLLGERLDRRAWLGIAIALASVWLLAG